MGLDNFGINGDESCQFRLIFLCCYCRQKYKNQQVIMSKTLITLYRWPTTLQIY
uniref:Uncharacterized protein n=1 Tax=Manihot esculenta TaxID=3983 RepID=A0A2C9WID9_MANES